MTRRTHDHELVIGSTTERLYLARGDNGESLYQAIEIVPDYKAALEFKQENWINGHGQHTFDDQDAFFEGQSIDTTQDGSLFLAPLITEVQENDDTALDSAPVVFLWAAVASKWLCATSGKIYLYNKDDTGIDTDEELDATETAITCDADATTAIPVGSIIHIENELMFVSATGVTLTVTRGYRGTTAATHVTNTDIYISKWQAATTVVAGVLDLKEFNGYVFAACGSAVAYKYSADGDTWTTGTLADPYAEHFFNSTNAAGTANVLWKSVSNELKYNASGINAGDEWSSAAYIGDTSEDINNIFLINDELLVGKSDNLYHYDSSGGLHPYMDDLKLARSTSNFKYTAYWQSGAYFSKGTGLGEITASATFDPMGALTDIDDIGKTGTVAGLTADTNWLYVAMDEGTNTVIYKGREFRTSKGLHWQWCPWVFLGTNACSTIAVCQHSATDRRLWFGYGTKTGYVLLSDNPLADSDSRFCPSGFIRMSYTYGSNPFWDKLYQSVVTETTGCGANQTVTPKYRKDTDTSASTLTAAIITNGVNKTNLTSALSCKRIQFELHLATTSSATTPQVLLFIARGAEKPEVFRIHEASYAIGDNPSNRAKTLRALMRTGRSTTSLIKFADLRYGDNTAGTAGTDYVYCVMEPGYPQEIEIIHEKGRDPEVGIKVRLREVNYS